ncbi:RNA polymerase sigma-70 factor [uncultured Bacteroides sp.]|uniref:RNA polymerase sigma-70 factor n=1 Tax=uncultured Bacteroides sp. TaxID=162156 RepID=UPI002AA6B30E|nr:RNA polymerase sigma-70 factor [uncultured Bacteroides sp.]
MLDDLLLLKKIKEGDIKTFEYVFRLYYSPLCLYAFGIIGSKDAAEEIVQELFYTLWKERCHLQILRSIKAYLYGAVRNQSLQYCEHHTVQERYRLHVLSAEAEVAPTDTPLDQLEYKELEEVINRVLRKLPDRRLRIFKMHRLQGLKYKEIAEILSLSVKTVEAEMTKTYQVLRKEIEKYTYIV